MAKVAANGGRVESWDEAAFATFMPTRGRALPGGGTTPGKPAAVQWSRASALAPATIPDRPAVDAGRSVVV